MYVALYYLAQLLPPLPADPQAAAQSYTVLVFFVASLVALATVIGIALRARGTIDAMIKGANEEVVERLDSVVVSVNGLTAAVSQLNVRDGITSTALEAMKSNYDNLDRRVDELVRQVCRLEGVIGARGSQQ